MPDSEGEFNRWQGRIEARLDKVEEDVKGIHRSFEAVLSRLSNIDTTLASMKTRVGIIVAIAGFAGALLANWLITRG